MGDVPGLTARDISSEEWREYTIPVVSEEGKGVGYANYRIKEPVTLYVTYRTVTADAAGVPTFRDDVYGRDRRVVRAMAKP